MSERFEVSDLSPRSLVRGAASLALAVLLIIAGICLFLHVLRHGGQPNVGKRIEPPPPRLQSSPSHDLAELRAREEQALTTYHWLDRKQQIIAIPIDRAIELTLERGLPARSTP